MRLAVPRTKWVQLIISTYGHARPSIDGSSQPHVDLNPYVGMARMIKAKDHRAFAVMEIMIVYLADKGYR